MNTLDKIDAITYSIEKECEVSTHTEYEQINEFLFKEKEAEEKFHWSLITFKLKDKTFEVTAQYDCSDNWTYYDDVSLSLEKVAYRLCKALDIDDTYVLEDDFHRSFKKEGEALEQLLIKALEESEPEEEEEEE